MRRTTLKSKGIGAGLTLVVLAVSAVIWMGCGNEQHSLTAPTPASPPVVTQSKSIQMVQSTDGPTLAVSGTFCEYKLTQLYDEFTITNSSDPGVRISEIIIDVAPSQAGVFFDVRPKKPGVLPCYPFLTGDGWDIGMTGWVEKDGSTSLRVTFDFFDPGKTFTFETDVDRLVNGKYREFVSGNEFAGTQITVKFTTGGPVDANDESGAEPLDAGSITAEYVATGAMTAAF